MAQIRPSDLKTCSRNWKGSPFGRVIAKDSIKTSMKECSRNYKGMPFMTTWDADSTAERRIFIIG
jgi:hypothetical protein